MITSSCVAVEIYAVTSTSTRLATISMFDMLYRHKNLHHAYTSTASSSMWSLKEALISEVDVVSDHIDETEIARVLRSIF